MDFQKIIGLLPHKEPMLMIDNILSLSENQSQTRNKIKSNNPFLTPNGTLSEFAYIELMAQTAAAFLVHYYYQQGRTETALGYVIGISSLEINHLLKINEEITITANLAHSIDNYHVFQIGASSEKTLYASGELKIYAQV